MHRRAAALLIGAALVVLAVSGAADAQSPPRPYPAGGTLQTESGERGVWCASVFIDDDGVLYGIAGLAIGSMLPGWKEW